MHQYRVVRVLFVCAVVALAASAFAGPLRVQSITMPMPAIQSGQPARWTVTLNGPAGKNGATVAIASSNPTVIPAPSTLFFPQGQSSQNMQVYTTGVAQDTPVTITATLGVSVSASITVLQPWMQSLNLPFGLYGGLSSYVVVELTGIAPPGGATVTLASTDPSLAQAPATIVVPAGSSTGQGVLTTSPTSFRTRVWISASYNNTTIDHELDVIPPDLSSVTVSPSQVTGGSETAVVSVNLTSPAPGEVTIEMTSSDPSIVAVPQYAVVPQGATSTSFTVSPAAVAATTNVEIRGYQNFVFYQNATLQVNP